VSGDQVVRVVVAFLLGYLSGSLAFGLWLGRLIKRVDVRQHGSRNMGATNVYRVLGPGIGIATLLLDMLKGALPVWIVPALPLMDGFPGGREWCTLAVGVGAVAGHVWTMFAGFRGGKGVATTVGVLLAMAPFAMLVFIVVFVVTVVLTRYVSLGSVLGSLAFCLALVLTTPGYAQSPTVLLGVVLALIVVVRHRENLRRLARGEENRFSWRRGAKASAEGSPP
jgi:glycerol-3-phosphate acyltransferase PlsY